MNYNPVGWFEIAVNDIARAQKFYETLFGVSMKREDSEGYEMAWFPSDMSVKGIPGALMKGYPYTPSASGTVVYFTCPDINATLTLGEHLGSKIILPKKSIGEYGTIAWLTDSEGNIIALHTVKK